MRDTGVDPSYDNNFAICLAAESGFAGVVDRLLRDLRVDPAAHSNHSIRSAATNGHIAVVDRLACDPRVELTTDPTLSGSIVCLGMIRTRATAVCTALHGLGLPALVTVAILDALLPNRIRMAAKWDLVTAVKHFHERRTTNCVEE